MAEQNRAGVYTQIVYSTGGQKLALMNGTTLQRAMLPLPGQAQAVYNSSGLMYYAHPDFLGTIRLATTPGEGVYFDTAYAPFGETYASTGTLEPSYTGQMNDTAHRQDTAGGLYDFPVREYEVQGRWPNPDPLGMGAACPKDPQTQNRYGYVRNNPMSYIDPTGADSMGPCSNPLACIIAAIADFFEFLFGGGHAERPRPFPWRQIPPGFFSSLENGGGSFASSNPEQPPPFPWPLLPAAFAGGSIITTEQISSECYFVGQRDAGCNYACHPEGIPGNVVQLYFTNLAALHRQCGWASDNYCPKFVDTISKTVFVFGYPIFASTTATKCSDSSLPF